MIFVPNSDGIVPRHLVPTEEVIVEVSEKIGEIKREEASQRTRT